MAELYRALPHSFTTPSMSPHCDDEEKYGVVNELTALIQGMADRAEPVNGQTITEINTVNGVRFTFADHSWGLIRASSNKPELVVVCESLKSEEQMINIFRFIESLLAKFPAVGAFNQKI